MGLHGHVRTRLARRADKASNDARPDEPLPDYILTRSAKLYKLTHPFHVNVTTTLPLPVLSASTIVTTMPHKKAKWYKQLTSKRGAGNGDAGPGEGG